MSNDLLYTILGICAIIVTACLVYLTYNFSKTLQRVNNTLEVVENTANDVNNVRRGVKSMVLNMINNFVKSQGGDTLDE